MPMHYAKLHVVFFSSPVKVFLESCEGMSDQEARDMLEKVLLPGTSGDAVSRQMICLEKNMNLIWQHLNYILLLQAFMYVMIL